MQRFKNAIVGVELDRRHDAAVVDYAEFVTRMAGSDRVHLAHVLPSPMSLGDLYPQYRQSFETAREEARDRIDRIVDGRFGGPERSTVRTLLLEGTPLVEILRLSTDEDADLVIVGQDHDGGTTTEKLARKAPCSVLIVPPDATPRIERVVVPVDFSEHAADAVDVAVAFAEAAGLEEIHLLHVYPVPTGYMKLGRDRDEFARQIHLHAESRFETFMTYTNTRGLRAERHVVEGEDVPATILRTAAELGSDLL
ncbi:MAG: universal stress protein, partial [Bacteroidota bacterium]